MKQIKKILLAATLFSLGVGFFSSKILTNTKETQVLEVNDSGGNQLPSNLISKEKKAKSAPGNDGDDFGPNVLHETSRNRAANPNDYYRVEFKDGSTKSYNSIVAAIGEMTNGSTFVLQQDIKVNLSSPVVFGKAELSDITFDLNGFGLTFTKESEFIQVVAKKVQIISSSPTPGILKTTYTSSKNNAIRVVGTSSVRPEVTLRNIRVTTSGDSALINQGGNVFVIDSYLKSTHYAVQTFKSGSLMTPILDVQGTSTIYGILAGEKGNTNIGGTIGLNGGRLLPYQTVTNGAFNIPGAVASTYLYANNIHVARAYLSNVTGQARNKYEVRQASSTTPIDSLNYYLDQVIRYQTVTYDAVGGVRISTGQAPTPEQHFFDGQVHYFPTDMIYNNNPGIKFEGWYSDKDYVNGPFTHRNFNHNQDRTYYARFTYVINFVSNVPANDVNKAYDSEGKLFTNQSGTYNTGANIYNPTPTGLTRPGYTLAGWSVHPDPKGVTVVTTLFSPLVLM